LRSDADVRAVPAEGLQTYPEPYPRFFEGAEPGPRVVGSVQVQDVKGMWALVSVDDEVRGWVDGRRLQPPISPPVIVSATPTGTMPTPSRAAAPGAVAISIDGIIGALAAIGILVGAALDWTQGIAGVTSFKIPVPFLFDYQTTSRSPDLGWFLIAIGVVAIFVALFVRPGIWRVLLGLLALVAASLFFIQIGRGLSDSNTNLSFTDIVGPGPWVTAISGFVLMLSPLFSPYR
jgi:hypothetical protein